MRLTRCPVFLPTTFSFHGRKPEHSSAESGPGPGSEPTRVGRVPNVQFRVLIIGRANAGKTSVLQRVCDTTDSPEIYRSGTSGTRNQVRAHSQWCFKSHGVSRLNSNPQWRFDGHIFLRTADHKDPVDSVAVTILRMNSSSPTIPDMFSTTPVGLSRAVRTS